MKLHYSFWGMSEIYPLGVMPTPLYEAMKKQATAITAREEYFDRPAESDDTLVGKGIVLSYNKSSRGMLSAWTLCCPQIHCGVIGEHLLTTEQAIADKLRIRSGYASWERYLSSQVGYAATPVQRTIKRKKLGECNLAWVKAKGLGWTEEYLQLSSSAILRTDEDFYLREHIEQVQADMRLGRKLLGLTGQEQCDYKNVAELIVKKENPAAYERIRTERDLTLQDLKIIDSVSLDIA